MGSNPSGTAKNNNYRDAIQLGVVTSLGMRVIVSSSLTIPTKLKTGCSTVGSMHGLGP